MKMLISTKEQDWDNLQELPWAQRMRTCAQSPEFHAEGDVWTHTRMVVDALLGLPEFHRLPELDQQILLHAALLHDVAKPHCTIIENGQISSPRHAKVGEKVTREILWNYDHTFREQVCALVRLHGLPVWGMEKGDPARAVILASWRVSNQLTYLLAKADVLGRICATRDELLYRVEIFRELCLENDCFDTERPWFNPHSRFKYYWSENTFPSEIYDDTRFNMIMMSGIAGSGKDTFCAKNYPDLPVISLDNIRRELKIKPDDRNGQGKVAQLAYSRAKDWCRQKQSFVWNSTNLTADLRARLIGTMSVYDPKITINYIETSLEDIFQRRKADIKSSILERMIAQLDMPLPFEAHEVRWCK